MRGLPPDLASRLKDGGRNLTLLVVRMAALGDVLRTLPALRFLRSALPQARILWVVDDRWASILEGHPDPDEIVPFPRAAWSRIGPLARTAAFRRWRRELRARRPGLALDFHGNLRSGIVLASSGAAVRVGFEGHQQKEGNRFFTTHHVPSGARRTSRIARNLSLVGALGIEGSPWPVEKPRLAPSHRTEARAIVEGGYAILAPGASRKQGYKKPPAALLAAAAAQLEARGVPSLVVWGPGEEADAEEVVRAAPGSARTSPATGLHVLAALLEGARAFVGGDSGPLHLACAMGCPVVGLYGPTDPVVNEPWGVPHVALFPPGRAYTGIKGKDREAGGFAGLEPEAVRAGVDEVLTRAGGAR